MSSKSPPSLSKKRPTGKVKLDLVLSPKRATAHNFLSPWVMPIVECSYPNTETSSFQILHSFSNALRILWDDFLTWNDGLDIISKLERRLLSLLLYRRKLTACYCCNCNFKYVCILNAISNTLWIVKVKKLDNTRSASHRSDDRDQISLIPLLGWWNVRRGTWFNFQGAFLFGS